MVESRSAATGSSTGLGADPGITRRPLAEQIKEQLLQAILEGRMPPDSRIVELQISRQLGTSQAPVREALRGLEALGVVEISPFRGARVRRPSTEEIIEAYAVRSELEALAARLAVPKMTPAALDYLESALEEMRRAAANGDGHAVAFADANFHAKIVEIGGNKTLARVWQTLEPFSRTLITLVMPGSDPMWSVSLHDPILAALREGNAELAAAALRAHFASAEGLAARLWQQAEAAIAPNAVVGVRR